MWGKTIWPSSVENSLPCLVRSGGFRSGYVSRCSFILKTDQQVRDAILRHHKITRDDQKGKSEMHKFERDAAY